MPTTSIYQLPLELLCHIGQAAHPSDLHALVLVCATWNDIFTPLLYARIHLDRRFAIYRCLETLASSPDELVFNRNLASTVRSLSIHDPTSNMTTSFTNLNSLFTQSQRQVLATNLTHALPTMTRLRRFRCVLNIGRRLAILTLLRSGTLPHLQHLELDMGPDLQYTTTGPPPPPPLLSPPPSPAIGLESLKVDLKGMPIDPSYARLLNALLRLHYTTLRSLVLDYRAGWAKETEFAKTVFDGIPSFPLLDQLCAPIHVFECAVFRDTSRIRHYILTSRARDEHVPSNVLPNLEILECFPDKLPEFLPRGAPVEKRRPIHTIKLHHITYAHNSWTTIGPCLQSVRFSRVPLQRLSVYLDKLRVGCLECELLPLVPSLEYLFIMFDKPPSMKGHQRNSLLRFAPALSKLPRLHTFLLSDLVSRHVNDHDFPFTHDEALQLSVLREFDEHCSSSLRRVAFTTAFEWEKRADGRWYAWGDIEPERKVERKSTGRSG
ncbi:hypothetical protein C8Q74DRAFT_1299236 [Fomes fomentarius]|nr:hypothetical protein C8Q74DRAFT_1299236 [Fomes fomentarius]